jgi:hypothetical protein
MPNHNERQRPTDRWQGEQLLPLNRLMARHDSCRNRPCNASLQPQ